MTHTDGIPSETLWPDILLGFYQREYAYKKIGGTGGGRASIE